MSQNSSSADALRTKETQDMPTKLAMPAKPGAKPVYYLISGIKKYRVIGIFLSLKSG